MTLPIDMIYQFEVEKMSTLSDNEGILILIPCCQRKEFGGGKEYDEGLAIANQLGPFAETLINLRRQLASYFGLEPGPDLGSDISTSIPYLPAFRRYAGNLYSKISNNAFQKLENCRNVKLVIVSALYGLLNWHEPIRWYNYVMSDRAPNDIPIWSWWKRMKIAEMIAYYVKKSGVKVVHDFLSKLYRKAINEVYEEIRGCAKYVAHDYPGLGSGSNFERGKDVNELIQRYCE
jgi:hypothetical protein